TYEQYGTSSSSDVLHLAQTSPLELSIADGQYLVDDQQFRFQMGCDGKCQADLHARGIAFYRRVKKLFDTRKINNFVELAIDFFLPHPQNCSVHVDVFTSGEFCVKA